MSQLAADLKDTSKSYRYLKAYVNYLNKLDYAGLADQMGKQALTYQFEKEKEIELQKHENEIQTQKNKMYVGIIGLLLVLSFSVILLNRIKIISKQKIFIEKQSVLVAEKNKEIIDSINYAQRIQKAMLTADSYINNELSNLEISHFVYFKPKDIVSGDFYWFYKKDSHLFFVTADCTGHGVPGGFMSMLGINLLNEIITEQGANDPGRILNKLRDEIIRSLQTDEGFSKDGMDAVICCINTKTLELTYAAANNSFYIVRDHKMIDSNSQKMPVGYMENFVPFTTEVFQLLKGDLIYTYTDGYADQFGGPKGKKFKYKQLEELILTFKDMTMEEQKEKLGDSFESWKANHEQVDDVCLIGLKI